MMKVLMRMTMLMLDMATAARSSPWIHSPVHLMVSRLLWLSLSLSPCLCWTMLLLHRISQKYCFQHKIWVLHLIIGGTIKPTDQSCFSTILVDMYYDYNNTKINLMFRGENLKNAQECGNCHYYHYHCHYYLANYIPGSNFKTLKWYATTRTPELTFHFWNMFSNFSFAGLAVQWHPQNHNLHKVSEEKLLSPPCNLIWQ